MNDPLHQPGSPTTHWTTINAEENLPGVTTPLSSSFWMKPTSVGTLGAFVELGVLPESAARLSDIIDERVISVFHGRLAANVDVLRRCADMTPATSGDALEEQLFAGAREGIPREGAPWRYPIVLVRAPRAAARVAGWINREFPLSQDWWARSIAQSPNDSAEKARLRLAAAHQHMTTMMRPHTLGTFMASGIYDQIGLLAESIDRPDLPLELSRGLGALEETDMLAVLWDVSRGKADLQDFLAVYGFHGPGEASPSATVWRQSPSVLESTLERYRAMPEDRSPRRAGERVRASRAQASRELLDALPRTKRPVAKLLLRLSDSYWPLRETGKATLLHSIDVGRASARRLGDLIAEEGRFADPSDVDYLTVEELIADDGRTDWQEAVAFRRSRRDEYLKVELPQTWDGSPDPTPIAEHEAVRELQGLGGSPGVVEGIARVVHDPFDDELEDGEVLVCETTDPSWASLFLSASAVVIDVGSPMSHGAIVAREMGLPCVINTRTGTGALRTGDRVRVDGGTGRVEVLS